MKNKLFNWSYRSTSDKFLNSIKKGVNNCLSDDLINNFSIKRMLKHNTTLASILALLIISNMFSYFGGSNSRDPEVENLTSEMEMVYTALGLNYQALDWKEKDVKDLKNELYLIKGSRAYLNAIVEKESGVEIPERVEDKHLKLMFAQADTNDIPYKVFFRVIQKESSYKWWVSSSAGAKGYMQVMPKTYKFIAEEINLSDSMTIESNIKAGSWYLKRMYDKQFDKIIHKKAYEKLDIDLNRNINTLSDEEYKVYCIEVEKIKDDTSYFNTNNKEVWELALSAYNAGGSNVGYDIPNIPETQDYVKFILKPYYEI